MKTVAIYSRVSTDNQEAEGTSLQTQLEACLKYCREKGYHVAYRFSEAYSGLALERPKLDQLRELVRNGQIDVIVVYCLDRLSRDPTHGVILTQELEKHGAKLEAVTEDIDNSELGKLITYLRGYASKMEAEKIRERTIRGKRARAKEGVIPSGSGRNIYGYDYIPVSQKNGGRRVINEKEAYWVRKIFEWLVYEGLSISAITLRLRAMNAPTKSGKIWSWRSVHSILTNPAYTGKTYVFTTVKNRNRFTRPQSDWIEIPDVTPAIISQELFDAAQKQLKVNRNKTVRTTKHEYLLRGHVRCRQCGRAYVGVLWKTRQNGRVYVQPGYRCRGKLKLFAPLERCHNKSWSAKRLEGLVWPELVRFLSNPDLIMSEVEKLRQEADQAGGYEAELERVERQLKALDREQRQLLQWALKGFPEDQVEAENRRLNKARETLKAQKAELEAQIKACRDAAINIPDLERLVQRIQAGIANLDFEGKRLALDALNITVWLDGENIEVTGVIEPENYEVRPSSRVGGVEKR
jgi:site-specific DNA recombinase